MANATDLPSFSSSFNEFLPEERPPSPLAPPYSPITPTMSISLPSKKESSSTNNFYPPPPHTTAQNAAAFQNSQVQAAPPQQQEPQVPPPSQPIHVSHNPDAIALRAAMSILQIQRQQALRDMQTLEEQKSTAMAHPEAFARGVSEGKVKARGVQGIIPTADEQDQTGDSEEDDVATGSHHALDAGDGSEAYKHFGIIPSAQNVVRMPPVNWAKYHIVGESLDKLHEEQRARPSQGQPLRDEDLRPRERASESVIAAPYNPWVDKVGEKPTRTRSGAKRK